MREAVFSDLAEACPWTRQLYASPESLSSTFVSAASNPSNFFASSSMEVVIGASNLVSFRDGARSKNLQFGKKKFRGGGSRYQLLRTGIGGEENQEEKDSNQENLGRIWGRSRSEFGFLIP